MLPLPASTPQMNISLLPAEMTDFVSNVTACSKRPLKKTPRPVAHTPPATSVPAPPKPRAQLTVPVSCASDAIKTSEYPAEVHEYVPSVTTSSKLPVTYSAPPIVAIDDP